MLALIVAFALTASAPAPGDAWRIIRSAQRAVETETEPRFEREWAAVAARNANDRRVLLARAALFYLRYQYERADSLYEQIIRQEAPTSEYAAAAYAGMGMWRAIGSDVVRAESLFVQARTRSLAAGDWHIAFQSLIALAKLRGRRSGPKVGLDLIREARSLADHPSAEETAQLLCAEGTFLEQLADTSKGPIIYEGVQIARRAGATKEFGTCQIAFAQAVERKGYFEDAARAADEAVRAFEKAHFTIGVASAAQWLGYLKMTRGYFAESRLDLERAVRAAQITRFTNVEAWARTGLAELYFTLGDLEAARANSERAAALHSAFGDLWGLAVDLQFAGVVASSRGRYEDASNRFSESVAAFNRAGLGFNSLSSLRLLALEQMRLGRLDSAQRALDAANRLGRASSNVGWEVEASVHSARLAMLRGDMRTADSLVALVRPHYRWRNADSPTLLAIPFAGLEAQLAIREKRYATVDSAVAFIAGAIAQRRRGMTDADLRAGLSQLRSEWGGLSDLYPELVAGLVAGGRVASAFQFIESVRAREIAGATLRTIARMTDSSAALAEFRRMPELSQYVSLEDAKRQMPSDEALVTLTLGVSGAPTTAIVVTSDTAVAISLPPRDVVSSLIDRYLRIAAKGTEPTALARQLGAALLQPIARVLPARVTRLSISPDGDLFRVPFDALRLADDRYAIQQFAISLVPSATVARMSRALPASRNATRLVAIGDPAFGRAQAARRQDQASRAGDPTRFASLTLARLPKSAEEARRVAEYGIHSATLTRESASETAVRTMDWRTVGVVHFATHALIDDEGQSRTALALTPTETDDGFLTPAEIAMLRFNGALVVLSACQSLGGQILGGEGLRGLTAPLFEAGARAIVVTHWSIGDRTVLPFVDRFYASMASGASVGDALRQTKLAAIHDGARISDWAAFTVIGDASMRPQFRARRLSPMNWLHDLMQPTRDTSAVTPR